MSGEGGSRNSPLAARPALANAVNVRNHTNKVILKDKGGSLVEHKFRKKLQVRRILFLLCRGHKKGKLKKAQV